MKLISALRALHALALDRDPKPAPDYLIEGLETSAIAATASVLVKAKEVNEDPNDAFKRPRSGGTGGSTWSSSNSSA